MPPSANSKNEILIYGLIDSESGISAKEIVLKLQAIPDDAPVRVRINSEGGDPFQALTMYHALRDRSGTVTTVNEGYAASAASLLFMAGDVREVKSGSQIMVHEPEVTTGGRSGILLQIADSLAKANHDFATIYSDRSGNSVDEVLEMLRSETYLTADEAVSLGFATTKSSAEVADKKLVTQMIKRRKLAMAKKRMEDGSETVVDETLIDDLAEQVIAADEVEGDTEGETVTISQAEYDEWQALKSIAEAVVDDAGSGDGSGTSMSDEEDDETETSMTDDEEKKTETSAKRKMQMNRRVKMARREAIVQERKRVAGINAICQMAGASAKATNALINTGATVENAAITMRKVMEKRNPQLKGAVNTGKSATSLEAKFGSEYDANQRKGIRMSSSRESYIRSSIARHNRDQ